MESSKALLSIQFCEVKLCHHPILYIHLQKLHPWSLTVSLGLIIKPGNICKE